MISLDEALALVRDRKYTGETEWVPLELAEDRVLAEDISAAHASPRFDNSAVDGFAVGSPKPPWKIVGMVAAGNFHSSELREGESVRIMTGAPTPLGTYAVVMQEDCAVSGELTCTEHLLFQGENIRRQGEEFTFGDIIHLAGTRITPPVLGSLRSVGLPEAPVRAMPKVGILSTGSELVEPGIELEPSQIYESNSLPMSAILQRYGSKVETLYVADHEEATREAVELLLQKSDLVITTGGASVGAFDYIPATIAALGFETVFSKVAIKPGKPVAFGTRTDGKAWFGLPGNPMSAQTTFLLFVLAAIGRELEFFTGALLNAYARKPGREEFVPANFVLSPDPGIAILPTVGSHATGGYAVSNGMARIPASVELLAPGEPIQFAFFPWSRLP